MQAELLSHSQSDASPIPDPTLRHCFPDLLSVSRDRPRARPNLGLREPIESARLKDRRHGLVHLASPRTEPFGRTVATERRDGRENGESPAGRDASREVNHEKEG